MIRVTRLGDLFHFGNFSKPAATIILPKQPTFLGNFCKVVKIFHFASEIIFRQLLQTIGDFLLDTLTLMLNRKLQVPANKINATQRKEQHEMKITRISSLDILLCTSIFILILFLSFCVGTPSDTAPVLWSYRILYYKGQLKIEICYLVQGSITIYPIEVQELVFRLCKLLTAITL